MNMNGFTVPNLSIFTFLRNITIKRQNIKISISPTSYTGLLRLSEKYTYKTFIHNIPKAQPNGNCRLASPVLRRWHYLWQSLKQKLFILKDKHLLWWSTTPKQMKLQTPDWSHFKGFKQLLEMRQPWIMQPFLFGSSTFPKMVFVSQEKRFLQRLNGG